MVTAVLSLFTLFYMSAVNTVCHGMLALFLYPEMLFYRMHAVLIASICTAFGFACIEEAFTLNSCLPFVYWHDALYALKADIHPFHPITAWLRTSLPNITLPQTRFSIIRPELIVMHFTAEVGKPYPWISTMYPLPPSNILILSVPSPLLCHPWPHCVTVSAVSREVQRSLPLTAPHPTSNPAAQRSQTSECSDQRCPN